MLFCLTCLFSIENSETSSVDFTSSSAHTLEDGQWSVGVFAPLRYGLSDTVELSLHPGWAVLAPHIGIKKMHGEISDWTVSSYHRIGYPSPMLKFFARPGIGGMLAADSVIPHIVSCENQVLFTTQKKQNITTYSAGVSVALPIGDSDYKTIDVPYAYRKTALYQNYIAVSAAVSGEVMFTERFGFRYETQGWFLPLAESKWALEDSNSLIVQLSEKAQMTIGASIVAGEYPYGTNWHVLPTFDTTFVW
jgi:hypothetical protein